MSRVPAVTFVLIALLLAMAVEASGALAALDRWAFGRLLLERKAGPWPDDFVAVVIDDAALRRHGRWPWPRSRVASLLARIEQAGARTIVVDGRFGAPTETAEDEALAARLSRVVMGAAREGGRPDADALATLDRLLQPIPCDPWTRIPKEELRPPMALFAEVAAGVGHVEHPLDRSSPMAVHHLPLIGVHGDGRCLPSLALSAWLLHRDLDAKTVVGPGRLDFPGVPPIRLHGGQFLVDYAGRDDLPPEIHVDELLAGDDAVVSGDRAPLPDLQGKLVLVYLAAEGHPDELPLPIKARAPGGLAQAFAIRTFASGRVPGTVPRGWVALAAALAGLLGAARLIRGSPALVLAVAAACIAAYLVATVVLVPLADVFLPVVFGPMFLGFAGALLAARAGFRMREENRQVQAALDRAASRADAAKAPRGEVALVFTDVQGSTRLWDRSPTVMSAALAVHNEVVRAGITAQGGYEVKTEGDSFMLAFPDPLAAVRWCVETQEALLDAEWPAELLGDDETRVERGPDAMIRWRGLRVRMGVHLGDPDPHPDPLTGRMDYFGPVVNRASRVVGAACGGQILVSGAVWERIEPRMAELDGAEGRDLGVHTLKGLAAPERLVEIRPASLRTREFPPPATGDGNPTPWSEATRG